MQQHSISELSLALITLRGLDLPLVQTEESESPAVFDDSSHLRNILLGQAVDRSHDCDSESTVTVNSEARMFSPSNSPEFVDTSYFQNINMWNNESKRYSPNSYMVEDNYLDDNKIEISKPNIGNSQDSGFWSDYSSQSKTNEPIIAQKKPNKKYDDLDSRQFFCNLCDRRYKKKSHLERHFRVHTGVRPYKCHICEKRFAVRSILKQHIRVHTGERPFSCDICSQRFPQKSGLMTHMMLHNGKPFKCEYCVKSFVSNHKLMLHQRSHGDLLNGAPHQGPYCCPSCDMRFFTAGALAEHAKVHNPTADDFTISEDAARAAVSAIGMFSNESPDYQSEIPEYNDEALGYNYQSDTLDIVKNEIFEDEEEDLAPGFLCEARWGGIEDMCI
ncbi:zinc finger protein 235-like isoform X2 [Thrips palmi]|nr:zinc finger protein 235-like isoform X2 [Thrips palmi]